ncbi:RecX family transcriptional regulator [Chloroflexota bacterium]
MGKKITAIEPQKNDPKRVNIFLDGEFGFGLSGILAAWLKIGQELSNEKINQLNNDDQLEKANQRALNFISYRPRSIHEVRKNLEAKDISTKIIEKVLARLKENSILNDKDFANQWVENRVDFHPRSRFALRMELRTKGITEDIIEDVLEDLDDDKLAYKAVLKYSKRLERMEESTFRKKLSSYLARKGFSYTSIFPVVDEIWMKVQRDSKKITSNNEDDKWTQ